MAPDPFIREQLDDLIARAQVHDAETTGELLADAGALMNAMSNGFFRAILGARPTFRADMPADLWLCIIRELSLAGAGGVFGLNDLYVYSDYDDDVNGYMGDWHRSWEQSLESRLNNAASNRLLREMTRRALIFLRNGLFHESAETPAPNPPVQAEPLPPLTPEVSHSVAASVIPAPPTPDTIWVDAATIVARGYFLSQGSLVKLAKKHPSIRRDATSEDRKRLNNDRVSVVYDARQVYELTEGKSES